MLLDLNNYKDKLKGISVVEVSGEGCANCITLLPILSKLVKQYKNVNFYHLEVSDETKELVKSFLIDRVPTVLIFKDLEIVSRCNGFQPEEILSLWLDAKINALL